jgi:hypothetical protein
MRFSRVFGLASANQAAQTSYDQIELLSASASNTTQPSSKYMAQIGTFVLLVNLGKFGKRVRDPINQATEFGVN